MSLTELLISLTILNIFCKERKENVIDCYPARVKFRGFSTESNTKGYIAISEYLKNNIDDMAKEAKDE